MIEHEGIASKREIVEKGKDTEKRATGRGGEKMVTLSDYVNEASAYVRFFNNAMLLTRDRDTLPWQ